MRQMEFLIILACTPVFLALLQALLTRLVKASGQISAVMAAVAGFIPSLALSWILFLGGLKGEELFWALFYWLTVYVALSYCYFHIFNMSETARRIRILHEIYRHGRLRKAEIGSLYSAGEMLDNRLERLVSTGQIRREGNGYGLKSKTLYYAALLVSGWASVIGLGALKGSAKKGEGR